MSKYPSDRNKKYGRDQRQRGSGYHGNRPRNNWRKRQDPPNQKSDNKKQLKLPSFMEPSITISASNKAVFHEEGGSDKTLTGYRGSAKILCSYCGKSKRPIYVFRKRKFESTDIHKKSLVFFVQKGDYIISTSFRSITEQIPGLISVGIYNIVRDNKNRGRFPKGKKVSRMQPIIKHTIIVSFPYTSSHGQEMFTEHGNKMGITQYFEEQLDKQLTFRNLNCLKNAILVAINKMCSDETTYSYYHNSTLARKLDSIDAI
jgi:hypothetical protein